MRQSRAPVRSTLSGVLVAYWVGLGTGFLVFAATSSATHMTAAVSLTDQDVLTVSTQVDQGTVASLTQAPGAALGTLRLAKRTWGLLTTYHEELRPSPVMGTQGWSGQPLRVSITLPGAVRASAPVGHGGTAVWDRLPSGPLEARSHAINWTAALALLAASALPLAARLTP